VSEEEARESLTRTIREMNVILRSGVREKLDVSALANRAENEFTTLMWHYHGNLGGSERGGHGPHVRGPTAGTAKHPQAVAARAPNSPDMTVRWGTNPATRVPFEVTRPSRQNTTAWGQGKQAHTQNPEMALAHRVVDVSAQAGWLTKWLTTQY
jgi:hypothetical protein